MWYPPISGNISNRLGSAHREIPTIPYKGYRRPDVLSNDSLTILQKIQQFQYVQHTTKDAAYYLAKSLWLGSPNAEVNQSDFGPNKTDPFLDLV